MPEEAPILGEIRFLTDQLKALVEVIDELSLILDHLSRNQGDTRYAVYNLVEKPQLCLETVETEADTLACAFCDISDPGGLAEALRQGWTRLQYDPKGMTAYFLGCCPSCNAQQNAPEPTPKKKRRGKGSLFDS